MAETSNIQKTNSTIDVLKVLMAILVVGIHTEPFGFNLWLDRGFGIITRLCVPFFFITSAYFYWLKDNGTLSYLKKIISLYVIWSVIYLPFDINSLAKMSIGDISYRFLWEGNGHALWYLWGSTIGFVIVKLLLKLFKPKTIVMIGFAILFIACLKSTWSPLLERLFLIEINDRLGSRNGLFYAFPYMALGMFVAKSTDRGKDRSIKPLMIGFIISLFLLVLESVLFVIVLKTSATIMWISVFPYAYFLFMLGNNVDIRLNKNTSLFLRKISTLIYVSHHLFIYLYHDLHDMLLFLTVSISSIVFAIIIIELSKIKILRWLRFLY